MFFSFSETGVFQHYRPVTVRSEDAGRRCDSFGQLASRGVYATIMVSGFFQKFER